MPGIASGRGAGGGRYVKQTETERCVEAGVDLKGAGRGGARGGQRGVSQGTRRSQIIESV